MAAISAAREPRSASRRRAFTPGIGCAGHLPAAEYLERLHGAQGEQRRVGGISEDQDRRGVGTDRTATGEPMGVTSAWARQEIVVVEKAVVWVGHLGAEQRLDRLRERDHVAVAVGGANVGC